MAQSQKIDKKYALMPLGEILLDLGYISPEQWELALKQAEERQVEFRDVLLAENIITTAHVTHAMALQSGLRFWNAARVQHIVAKHQLHRIPPPSGAPPLEHLAWSRTQGPLLIAISDLNDADLRSQLKAVYENPRCELVAVAPETLRQIARTDPLPSEVGMSDRRTESTDILDAPPAVEEHGADTLPPDVGNDARPGTVVDYYRIIKRLAAGAAGVVYMAEDTRTGERVALKRLHPELASNNRSVEQLTDEWKLLEQFNHPNIIRVYGGGRWDDVPYFSMELMPGDALGDRLTGGEPMPIATIMRVWCQIADALAYAHRMGVLHRDIKPANVLLTERTDAKVVDFGIARPTDMGGSAAQTGTAAGTLLYMAPEQLRGQSLSPGSDIYALGMVAFQMLTGELLDGNLDLQVMLRRRQQREVSFDDVRRPLMQALQRRSQMGEIGASLTDFARILHRCLRKNPRDRYGSAEELGKNLRELMQLRGWPAPVAPPLPVARPHAWSSGDTQDGAIVQPDPEETALSQSMPPQEEPRQNVPDDYEVIKHLGRGSMGEVFLARDRDTGRQVALKMIAPEMAANERFRSRFQREAEVLGRLNHESIVHIYGVQFEGPTPHIAMEYIDGEDLDVILKERGELTLWESVPIITQVADALEHVHAHGVIHRDLKPSNLMITREGKVKILDFGVAKDSEGADLTNTGAVIGTPHYMSPEQAAGKRASPLSDMYALGMIWWQLLVGSVPFRGTIPEVLHMHIAIQPPRVSDRGVAVPESVDRLISRMLRKEVDQRPQSFQEVIRIANAAIAPPPTIVSFIKGAFGPAVLVAVGVMLFRYGFQEARSDWQLDLTTDPLIKGVMWGGGGLIAFGTLTAIWRVLRAVRARRT